LRKKKNKNKLQSVEENQEGKSRNHWIKTKQKMDNIDIIDIIDMMFVCAGRKVRTSQWM
jgi:hypothetical protein